LPRNNFVADRHKNPKSQGKKLKTQVITIFEVYMDINITNDPSSNKEEYLASQFMIAASRAQKEQREEKAQRKAESQETKFILEKEDQAADEKKQAVKSQDKAKEEAKTQQIPSNPYGI
jgi:hypothetical protein